MKHYMPGSRSAEEIQSKPFWTLPRRNCLLGGKRASHATGATQWGAQVVQKVVEKQGGAFDLA